jgi:hypothetical protein
MDIETLLSGTLDKVVHEWAFDLNTCMDNVSFCIARHFHYDALSLFLNLVLCAYDLGFIPTNHQ